MIGEKSEESTEPLFSARLPVNSFCLHNSTVAMRLLRRARCAANSRAVHLNWDTRHETATCEYCWANVFAVQAKLVGDLPRPSKKVSGF